MHVLNVICFTPPYIYCIFSNSSISLISFAIETQPLKKKKIDAISIANEIKEIEELEKMQYIYGGVKQRTFKTCKKGLEIIKYLDWEFNGKFAKCISDDDAIFQEDEINLIF